MQREKRCIVCGESKTTDLFYSNKTLLDGLDSSCKNCRKAKNKNYRIKNKDYYNKYSKQYRADKSEYFTEYMSAYYEVNKDRWKTESIIKYRKAWLKENKKQRNEYMRQYKKDNPHIFRYHNSKRRAVKLQALPSWADLEKIKGIYNNCPEGYVVDHVIPLQGKNVCGFHIEDNLQYLTPKENSEKYNKFER